MNKTKHESNRTRFGKEAACVLAIIAISTALGMGVAWRAPGLELYARDLMMRARGRIAPPAEVVIVAIDEASLARLGRFPWPRSLVARGLDRIAAARPAVIALDVLYSDPSEAADDRALAEAIARAGNVVVGAQLIETADAEGRPQTVWVRPLDEIEKAAAGVGHVHVATGFDGVARALTLRQADDDAQALWAMAVETARVADRLNVDATREEPDSIRIGSRVIPVNADRRNVVIGAQTADTRVDTLRAASLTLDYVGPSGSFSAQTYSFSDVLDGRVTPENFHGKYALIGATAAALGDRIASPFVRAEGDDGRQHGEMTPGVEVLANALHTILRERFYRETPDWMAAVCAASVAAAAILLLAAAQGRWETIKQLGAIAGLVGAIVAFSYLAFTRRLIAPPLAPMLLSCAFAVPLVLLRRSLAISADLDERIAELAREIATDFPATDSIVGPASDQIPPRRSRWRPRGGEWKARALGHLSRGLLARSRFVERALHSVEDGLIVASVDGRIAFANPRAAAALRAPQRALVGSDLFERLGLTEQADLHRLLVERAPVEREITIGDGPARHYALRLSAVCDQDGPSGEALGIVASLSDITRHRELQQSRNEVMALVSHELKTPLTAIQGMSELLSEFEADADRRREMSLTINDEAKRLAQMIDEYLDITRLESGARPLRLTSTRVAQLIERALTLLAPVAERRGMRVTRRFAPNLPALLADADLLARAVANLVANAIKFSPPRSEVIVEARAEGETMLIIVADQGRGIPAESLPRIFEKFYRVPCVEDDDEPGAGLGLAFVRETAELHGGNVTAEAEVDAGSTFTLRLPLAAKPEEI